MRQSFTLLLLSLWIISCKNSSGAGELPEDSLHYIATLPEHMEPREIKRYGEMLDTFFEHHLIDRGFNGSILVAKKGNILYEKYVGFRDLRLKDSLTDTTSFHLASTSKPFTGMSILWLVQQGKLSLDDSIQKFFPAIPYPDVTVKLLLNHRSGIPNYVYFMAEKEKWDQRRYVTNESMLEFIYREKPPRSFKPDSRFSYSNTNYVLLAMIIEKLSGKSYPDFLKENIFIPLHMDHSYVFTLSDTNTATHSFEPSGGLWKNDFLEGTYGDKNVFSTPRDMLRWDQALYTDQFIRKSLLDTAYAPYSNERPSIHNYGLGWRMLTLPGNKKVIYHFGRWHGFTPAFARLIDQQVTIIILGNKFNRNIYSAAHKAYDLFGDYGSGSGEGEEEPIPAKAGSKLDNPAPPKGAPVAAPTPPIRKEQLKASKKKPL